MTRTLDRVLAGLWLLVTAGMGIAIWLVFRYAPEEQVMGAAQKIFYFHVPAAIVTFVSVFLLLGAGVGYLWTRDRRWDHLARGATEAGFLFCTLVLTTGPLWAKPAWGVWWTWEAKITTTLILWLLLAACLLVRSYATNPDLGARLAAIVGIVAAVDVPIIHKATVWWRGQHPILFEPGKGDALTPEMLITFQVCIAVFFALFALIIGLRYKLAHFEDRVDQLLERLH